MNRIRAAKLETSPRLQRFLLHLVDGRPHTTRDIVRGADVMAVNSCAAELRENGWKVACVPMGRSIYAYHLDSAQTAEAFRVLLRIATTGSLA